MGATLIEWLGLAFRWLHVVAGVCWIGNSFYFMWLDAHLDKPKEDKEGVEGELWMCHSGGFYQVEKRQLGPGQVPPVLHWFKWESYTTWVSGFFLLAVVYYLGGGVYLVDSSVSSISVNAAIALGVGLLVVSWFIYDMLCHSLLARNPKVFAVVGYLLTCGVAFGLSHILSGRAAFIHVGAMLGTLMAGNVLMRIIPAQKKMIAATKSGDKHNVALGLRAKQRSIHNNYMTLPVIFIMLSNHFPSTYGHEWNWLILAGLFFVGANIRHFFNVKHKQRVSKPLIFVPAAILFLALFYFVSPKARKVEAPVGESEHAAVINVDPEKSGMIKGLALFDGKIPEPKKLSIPSDCAQRGGPVYDRSVIVNDGKLKNAFIWIGKGLEGYVVEPPKEVLVIDQRGCMYEPHITGAVVGQTVKFLNSDSVFHNVRTVSKHNPAFNEFTPAKNTSITKKFAMPEFMVKTKCDVHPWMGAYIGVVSHPFFAISDENGKFKIEGVPPGKYTLEAWHEVYGRMSKEINLAESGAVAVDFKFKDNR